jgi:hypothetical protein
LGRPDQGIFSAKNALYPNSTRPEALLTELVLITSMELALMHAMAPIMTTVNRVEPCSRLCFMGGICMRNGDLIIVAHLHGEIAVYAGRIINRVLLGKSIVIHLQEHIHQ